MATDSIYRTGLIDSAPSLEDWARSQGYRYVEGDDQSHFFSPEGERFAASGNDRTYANLLNDYLLAQRYGSPEIWGTEGMYYGGLSNVGSGESSEDIGGFGEGAFTVDGKTYIRSGTLDQSRFAPFITDPSQNIYSDQWGWGIDPAVAAAYSASGEDVFDKYGPLIALAGIGAVTAPAIAAGAGAAEAGAGTAMPVGSTSTAFGTGAAPTLTGTGGTFGSIPTSFGWESFLPGGTLSGSTGGLGALTGIAEGGGGMDWWDDILTNVADTDDFIDVDWSNIGFDDFDNFGALSSLPSGSSTALQQNIDGIAQTIYDANAAAGVPGYDPSLASTTTGAASASGVLGPLLKALGLDSGVIGGALSKLGPLDLAALVGGISEMMDNDPTVTTRSESVTLPDWYTAASQKLLSEADAIEPSTGWQPYLDKATGYTDQAAGGLPSIDLDAYMNPYLDSVLDPMRDRYVTDRAQTLQGIDNRAASVNAFGRNRSDLLKTQASESADRTWNETEARIRSGAFDTAAANATRDLDRRSTAGKTYGDFAKTFSGLDWTNKLGPLTAYSTALKSLQLPKSATLSSTTINPPPSLLGIGVGGAGALGVLSDLAKGSK